MSTKIEWTNETWNPTKGCSRVSPECDNCYAMRQARRHDWERTHDGVITRGAYHGLTRIGLRGVDWSGRVELAEETHLALPLHWRDQRLIFVDSMSDLFHEANTDEAIDRVFGVMWACLYGRGAGQGHVFQILTKRAERMLEYMSQNRARQHARWAVHYGGGVNPDALFDQTLMHAGPHPRIWLGVSAGTQDAADERIPLLLRCPAALYFVSAEPLLELVRMGEWMRGPALARAVEHHHRTNHDCAGCGDSAECDVCRVGFGPDDPALGWVITGDESGEGSRPMHPRWATSLRDECEVTKTPFFFKQWGNWRPLDQGVRPSLADRWCSAEGGSEHWNPSSHLSRAGTMQIHGDVIMRRYKKRVAGAHLDGRLHLDIPTPSDA